MDHSMHDHQAYSMRTNPKEYAKFAGVILFILVAATAHSMAIGFDAMQFIRSFMGMFLVTFAGFKLLNLKMFAVGFGSYDVLAEKIIAYAYLYPFIQLAFGGLFLAGVTTVWLDAAMLCLSLFSSIGVFKELGRPIKCACLGNFVQLPLSTISLIEDLGMAALAATMIVWR